MDFLAVGLDGRLARDGGPFAAAVDEADVDFWVGFQVVGLAGFGVGVVDEVDAVALL